MRSTRFLTIIVAAGALTATPLTVLAQSPAPSTGAGAAQSATYSDAQLSSYAKVQAKVEAMKTMPQGTAAERKVVADRMAAAAQKEGMTVAQYNEISAAVRADPSLARRVAQLGAAGGPAGSGMGGATGTDSSRPPGSGTR